MNTEEGALHFETTMGNDQLVGAVNEAERRIKGFSSATAAEGKKIDKVFNDLATRIQLSKDLIAGTEADIKKINAELDKIAPGQAKADLEKEVKSASRALAEEKQNLAELERQANMTEAAHVTLRTRLRQMKEELVAMEQAGMRGTAKYEALRQEFAHLTDSMADAQRQANILANDERGMAGVIQGLTGVTGAASAAQGAIGLFSGENENLQKIMLKVQSLMAITIGLQQIQQTLNKDSAFMLVTVGKAKTFLAAAENRLAIAFGISNVAAKALMATLSLGLSVAIGIAIAAISKIVDKSKEARKATEEFNKAAADNAYKTMVEFERLRQSWDLLGDDLKAKKKFIDDNVDSFEDLGVQINNITDADNLFITNTEAFKNAIIARAKASAGMELAAQKYKESLQKMQEAETMPDTKMRTVSYGTVSYGSQSMTNTYEVENKKKAKALEEAKKLEEEANNFITGAIKNTNASNKQLENANISTTEAMVEGSIAAIEAAIKTKQESLEKLTDPVSYSKVMKDIEKLEVDLRKITGEQSQEEKNAAANARKQVLEAFKDELQLQLETADSIIQKLNIINQRRKDLSGEPIDKDKNKILEDASLDVAKQARQQTKDLLNEYSNYLDKKIQMDKEYYTDLALLESALSNASTPEERSRITGAIAGRKAQYSKDSKKSGDKDYDSLIESYRNFEQKKQAIIDEFEEKRQKAQEHGNDALIVALNEAQTKALSNLATEQMIGSSDWTKVFSNLDRITAQELIKLKNQIESQFSNLDLLPEDLNTLRDKLKEIEDEIAQKNPFLALSEALKKYLKTQDKADLKDAFKSISGSIDLAKGAFDSVTAGLDKMGVKVDDQTQVVLDDISGIMSGASNLAQGLATGNPLLIVQGVIEVISNGIDLIFGAKDRKLDKVIEDDQKAVDKLINSYENLERAVEAALGTGTYEAQKALIANLQQQQTQYLAMIKAEKSKKKPDKDKIDEYLSAYQDISNQIRDIQQDIVDELLQTSIKDLAQGISDALVTAFQNGESAAKAFDATINDMMLNLIKNSFKVNVVEKALQPLISKMEAAMSDYKLSDAELEAITGYANSARTNILAGMRSYQDLISQLNLGQDAASLSGSIKGITEDTADVLAGTLNAIRITQAESVDVIRRQLSVMTEIAKNTRYNKYLESIDAKLDSLSSESLRASGLNG